MSTVFHTKQFKAGNSQAVRLPSKLAYPPETELTITRIGEKLIIEPTAGTPDGFISTAWQATCSASSPPNIPTAPGILIA